MHIPSTGLYPSTDAVYTSGSTVRTLTQPTTFALTATGVGGVQTVGTVTVNVIMENAVHITYPAPGQLIKRPDTIVQGTVDNIGGDEVGVVVNGVIANVYFNGANYDFAANHVPLSSDDSYPIIVAAKSTNDYIATAMITVKADTTGHNVSLTSNVEFGLTPLDVTLSLAKCTPTSTYSFTYNPNNDSIVNMGDDNTALQFKRRFTQPGLYYITVDNPETLDDGTIIPHSDKISILAETPQQFNDRARGKWSGMTAGLAAGSAADFIKYFGITTQDKYSTTYNQLMPVLSDVATALQANTIQFVYLDGNVAKYNITHDEINNGQPETVIYSIYFIKDMDGLWKIDKF